MPTAGIHTLNIWAREDGVEIDKVVLEIGGTIPSGFGPARSNLINPLMPPVVTAFLRDSQPGDQSVLLTRPDLLNALTFTFDQDINIDSDQLLIRNDSTSGTYRPFQGAFEYDSDTFTATWNVSPVDPSTPPLEPGFYTFSLNSANVSSVRSMQLLDGNGDGEEGDFFSRQVYVAIPGDANLDGSVDVLSDGFALVRNLGGTSGHTWGKGISMVTVPSMS